MIIEDVRDLYYHEGPRIYSEWLDDDIDARMFWDNVKDITEQDEWSGKVVLTPDDKEALGDACHGFIGRELFASILTWFYEHEFIRDDITVWNCRVFRYIDSYLMSRRNIVVGIFANYESLRDIESIRLEIMEFLNKSIPSHALLVLKNQIDIDEKYFETGLKEETANEKKDLLDLAHKYLRSYAEDIYSIIFRN